MQVRDGLVTTPLLYAAALYGLWQWLQSHEENPYDFSRYQHRAVMDGSPYEAEFIVVVKAAYHQALREYGRRPGLLDRVMDLTYDRLSPRAQQAWLQCSDADCWRLVDRYVEAKR